MRSSSVSFGGRGTIERVRECERVGNVLRRMELVNCLLQLLMSERNIGHCS